TRNRPSGGGCWTGGAEPGGRSDGDGRGRCSGEYRNRDRIGSKSNGARLSRRRRSRTRSARDWIGRETLERLGDKSGERIFFQLACHSDRSEARSVIPSESRGIPSKIPQRFRLGIPRLRSG